MDRTTLPATVRSRRCVCEIQNISVRNWRDLYTFLHVYLEDCFFLEFHTLQYVKSTLMMEVTVSFETSVQFYQNTERRILEDREPHRKCTEKLMFSRTFRSVSETG